MDVARHALHNSNMVPTYLLYGEAAGDLPDVLHAEPISARAPSHGWQISPHRHHAMHQILDIRAGGGRLLLDGAEQRFDAPALIHLAPLAVHGFDFDQGTEGVVLTLPQALLPARPGPFVAIPCEGTRALVDLIAAEHAGAAPEREPVLAALAAALAGLLVRLAAPEPARDDPAGALLRRFEELIEARYTRHESVADYAAALGVSATHLSRVCRRVTGRPASRLIEARLVREARRMLVYTAMPVSQIAHTLGFTDPAYFSRVVRRATGKAPSALRRQEPA